MNRNKYWFFKGTNQIDIYLAKLTKENKEQTSGTEKEHGFRGASPEAHQ